METLGTAHTESQSFIVVVVKWLISGLAVHETSEIMSGSCCCCPDQAALNWRWQCFGKLWIAAALLCAFCLFFGNLTSEAVLTSKNTMCGGAPLVSGKKIKHVYVKA